MTETKSSLMFVKTWLKLVISASADFSFMRKGGPLTLIRANLSTKVYYLISLFSANLRGTILKKSNIFNEDDIYTATWMSSLFILNFIGHSQGQSVATQSRPR